MKYWKEYHLNDMNAGTNLQSQVIEWFFDEKQVKQEIITNFEKKQHHQKEAIILYEQTKLNHVDSYSLRCYFLKQHCLYNDMEYKYGFKWLVKPLPEEVITFFKELNVSNELNETEQWDWMKRNEIKCQSIQLVETNPFMYNDDSIEMDHWLVIFQYKDKTMSVYYSTGIGHRFNTSAYNIGLKAMIQYDKKVKWFKNNNIKIIEQHPSKYKFNIMHHHFPIPPRPDSVLQCIISDSNYVNQYSDYMDWASELGYDMNDKKERRKAKMTFLQCETQKENFEEFTEHRFDWDELNEIFQG